VILLRISLKEGQESLSQSPGPCLSTPKNNEPPHREVRGLWLLFRGFRGGFAKGVRGCAWAASDGTALNTYLAFPHVGQVFCLHRAVTELATGTAHRETVYGVTSLTPAQASPARLLALVRAHWTIENRLHWVRDVTFDEDRSQIRQGAGPQVMATLHNLAISLLRLAGAPFIAPALRQAGWAGHATIFRLLGIDLQAAEAGL